MKLSDAYHDFIEKLDSLLGGAARAAAMSPRKRSAIARKAAQARWEKIRFAIAPVPYRTLAGSALVASGFCYSAGRLWHMLNGQI